MAGLAGFWPDLLLVDKHIVFWPDSLKSLKNGIKLDFKQKIINGIYCPAFDNDVMAAHNHRV